jgi:hypothetical protein
VRRQFAAALEWAWTGPGAGDPAPEHAQVDRDHGLGEPDVYRGGGSGPHRPPTARILAAYEDHLLGTSPRPVAVVVVGDVNSIGLPAGSFTRTRCPSDRGLFDSEAGRVISHQEMSRRIWAWPG